MRKKFEGEFYLERVKLNDKEYEHVGFREKSGEFPKFMNSVVTDRKKTRKARITIELL